VTTVKTKAGYRLEVLPNGNIWTTSPDGDIMHDLSGPPASAVRSLIEDVDASQLANDTALERRLALVEAKIDLVDAAQVSGIRDLFRRVSAIEAELAKAEEGLKDFGAAFADQLEKRGDQKLRSGLIAIPIPPELARARQREIELAEEVGQAHEFLTCCGEPRESGHSLRARMAVVFDRQHREMELLESKRDAACTAQSATAKQLELSEDERDRVVGDLVKCERELHETQVKLAVAIKERDAAQGPWRPPVHHTTPTAAYPAVDDAEVGPPSQAMSLDQVIERYYGPELLNGLAALLQRLAAVTK
jgi:hypothetical protein